MLLSKEAVILITNSSDNWIESPFERQYSIKLIKSGRYFDKSNSKFDLFKNNVELDNEKIPLFNKVNV